MKKYKVRISFERVMEIEADDAEQAKELALLSIDDEMAEENTSVGAELIAKIII